MTLLSKAASSAAFLRIGLFIVFFTGFITMGKGQLIPRESTRQVWLNYMDRVARPMMKNMAENTLKLYMPVTLAPHPDYPWRKEVAYLEGFGRTLSGLAPWLESEGGDETEVTLRNQYRVWALKGIANAVNPDAKDYLKWNGAQPLVDASFFALALVRSPWIWTHLKSNVQQQVVHELKRTREIIPAYTNWLLFSGMIESFFEKYNLDYDAVRIDYGLKEFMKHWYVGDGMFSDGTNFHVDYYNSIVIHPYLSTIMEIAGGRNKAYDSDAERLAKINQRYAQLLERLICSDGSFPATGRSIVYRGGLMHHLAYMAYKQQLPPSLKPAQVRCALTAVIVKTLASTNNFDGAGWLKIGLSGDQPNLADSYITTGSLYICANIFLPLGLPATNKFWSSPDEKWTSVKIWNGEDVEADHALDLNGN